MDHRRTPSRKAYVPSSWFIVASIIVCLGAAGWLGWLLVDGGSDLQATPSTPSSAPTVAPTTAEPPPTTPTPTETTPPPVEREMAVSVLNNTPIRGLAGTFAENVRGAGWTVGSVGNWRGSIPNNTVYYPTGAEDQAKLLAEDVDIDRVMPRISSMRADRLTVILSGPQ